MPKVLPRIEAKIDHLEKSINKKPSIAGTASTVGRALGGLVGQGDLGSLAASQLAKMFGHGDYLVKTNSLMTSLSGPSLPKFGSNGTRGTRIREREYLGDIFAGTLVSGATAFSSSNYPINPTNPKTFPWLSNLADLFDQWEPHGIVFEFVTTSSEYNGSSQALGTVIMATDYDPYDPLYSSKIIMENADYASSTKPSCSLVHGVECDVRERPTPILYTVTTNPSLPLTSSLLGNFQLATQGMSVTGVSLGELWISYDITFYKKQLNNLILNPLLLPFYSVQLTSVPGTGQINGSALSGPTSYQITLSQTSVTSIVSLNNSTFPQSFVGRWTEQSSNSADSLFSQWTFFNCTVTNSQAIYPQTAGAYYQAYIFLIATTGPNATITTGKQSAGGSANITSFDIAVCSSSMVF